MAELFQKDRTVVTKHINNIFKEGELKEEGNVQNLHFPNSDKPVKSYNLDVIISVGYRVKSHRGTQNREGMMQQLSNLRKSRISPNKYRKINIIYI
ncbi:MAG: RhuM family protein [Lutisporaceae bacterium]